MLIGPRAGELAGRAELPTFELQPVELENVLKSSAAVPGKKTLAREDLPETIRGESGPSGFSLASGGSLKEKIAGVEKCLIEEALHRTRGNVTRAARELDFPLRSLKRKLSLYRISPKYSSRPTGEK